MVKVKKIIIAVVLILMLCLSLNVNANTMLTSKSFKFEHDRSILSRIAPKITVEQLKLDLNQSAEKIKIYEDNTCKKEITKGYIKTDMTLKYEDKKYTLIVVGDIDKDGEITKIDLNKTIKHIVNLSNQELTNIYYEAADITGDGLVDQRDLTKYIRYITLNELELGNIDTQEPKLELKAKDITSSGLKVEATATDLGIGMGNAPIYTFYVKKANEADASYVEKQSNENTILELNNLEQNTEYEIKVITHDNSGNEAIQTIKVTTKQIPDGLQIGALTIENPIWNKGKADVKITTNTTYQIEYQINGTTGTWKKATKGNNYINVTNLEHNDVIYARLTDGINSGNYITATIIDNIKPQLTLLANTGTSNIEVIANAKDNETGIGANAIYTFYIKESDKDDSTYVESQKDTKNKCEITNLDQAKEYTIKVEVADIAGNITEETIKVSTYKIPNATDAGALNIGNTIWKNQEAQVEISSTNTKFQVEYVVNDLNGNWIQSGVGNSKITATGLKHNDIVYVRLTDGKNVGDYIAITILDNIKPEINVNLTPSTSEIEVEVTAQDFESGIADDAQYKLYVKKDTDTSYVYVNSVSLKDKQKLTNLEANKNYTIKVEVTDIAGNIGIKEITQITKEIPSATTPGGIMFDNLLWNNGKASITISTNTSFDIEYQINGTSGAWVKDTAPIDVTNLEHNDIIYARLTDGISSGSYVTATIVDTIIPCLTLNLTAQNQTIDAIATVTDNESGISNTATYKFSIKETGQPDTQYIEKQNTNDLTCTFTGLVEGKNYTIKLETEDIAGNKALIEKSILIPDDVAPIVTLDIISKTSSTVTTKAGATDVGGLPNPTIYKFYIKQTGADDSTYVEIQTGTSNTCIFKNLVHGKDYTLKVTVEDEAGNVGVKEVSTTTEKIPDATQIGAITFSSIIWENGKAIVTISTNTKFDIEYQVNGTQGTWVKGEKVSNLKHDDIIYARLTDGVNSSNPATLTVIDSIKPTITLNLTPQTSTMVAQAKAKDDESGISANAVYTFYLKEGNESYVQIQSSTEKTCTFTGLTQAKQYTVKVEVQDEAGNIGVKQVSTTTQKIPDASTTGAINFETPIWNKEVASIKIITNTNFKIEYQVNGTQGNWIAGTSPIEITNLKHNDVIYARLTDGINSGKHISTTITDTIMPQSFTIKITDIDYEELTITGSTTDNESGIDSYSYIIDNIDGKNEVEIKNQTVTSYKVTGLKAGTTYDVYMLAYDNAGNERKSKIETVTTKAVKKFVEISAGNDHCLAIDEEGNLWAWGSNNWGQLGNGTETESSVPIQVKKGTKFKKIKACKGSSSFAIDEDGNLWACGFNSSKQLGIETSERYLLNLTQIIVGTKFKEVSGSNTHTLAIDEEGNLWAWGNNSHGQLGMGTYSSSTKILPTKINIGINFVKVECEDKSSFGIDEEGNLWAWGYNSQGQLGIGKSATRELNPVQVKAGTKFKELSAGENSILAIDEDGNIWSWAKNSSGYVPVQVKAETKFKEIATGRYKKYLAIDEEGRLWAWGDYDLYDNALGITESISTPTQIAEEYKFKKISKSEEGSFAIDEEGNLWAWGNNVSNTLGIGVSLGSGAINKMTQIK